MTKRSKMLPRHRLVLDIVPIDKNVVDKGLCIGEENYA